MPIVKCKICGGNTRIIISKRNDPFGLASYSKCDDCDFLYTDHIERSNEELVANYYTECSFDKEDRGYKSRAETAFAVLKKVIKIYSLPSNMIKVLDYGCGEGTFIDICSRNNVNASGYDPYCKVKNSKLIIQDNELKDFKEYFDVVTAFEVVEHSCYPDLFAEMLSFCKPGGFLLFSTGIYNPLIHDENWDYLAPAHCSIYSVKSLKIQSNKCNADRVALIRHPFTTIPYLLTGELWRNGRDLNELLPSEVVVNNKDAAFIRLTRLIPRFLFKMAAKLSYYRKHYL